MFFKATHCSGGMLVSLVKEYLLKKQYIHPDQWLDFLSTNQIIHVAPLLRLLEEEVVPPPVAIENNALRVSDNIVAALSDAAAMALGLPSTTKLTLTLVSSDNIASDKFTVTARWMDRGKSAWPVKVKGCILQYDQKDWRIPEPLYTMWQLVDGYKSSQPDADDRFVFLAKLCSLLPRDKADKVQADGYLGHINVVHAAAFSLRLVPSEQGINFEPVLFSPNQKRYCEEEDNVVLDEAESLLSEKAQMLFEQRFQKKEECRPAYGLDNFLYVYIDPDLQKALTVVRQTQKADANYRRDFVKNPQLFIKEALGEETNVDALFIATEQYSERILELGIWQPVVLPWIKKDANQSWLPESFGLRIGPAVVPIDDIKSLKDMLKEVQDAIASGEANVTCNGVSIPVTQQTLTSIANLIRELEPTEGPAPGGASPREKPFLLVKDNYTDNSFSPQLTPREMAYQGIQPFPGALKTTLKEHQMKGLGWLQETWQKGLAGALLADDMGLGKTLTVWTFLFWLREASLQKHPILIVAPTGLLKNWLAEHELHFHEYEMDEVLPAFGSGLKNLRSQTTSSLSLPMLNVSRLKEASYILTSYETLRDYHHSFAGLTLTSVVFDEAQKMKNPASQISVAAKALNADYRLTMTGTPVENAIEDIWAILDATYPSFLPPLKEFSEKYSEGDIEVLQELQHLLMDSASDTPAVMLRRMKNDILKDLPNKNIESARETMPELQATTYSNAVTNACLSNAPGAMLKSLHAMRGISLFPTKPDQTSTSEHHKEFIASSARLKLTFAVLDKIFAKKEKALIFLESLDLQPVLAAIIKKKYGMEKEPMIINGSISGPKRQERVEEFQKNKTSFDVLIISPKAGGVGLTLTSANHVIHLSRWWNPAVEEQCTDRAYRIGQRKDVYVYYPLAIHPEFGDASFDVVLNTLLQDKKRLGQNLLVPPLSGKDENRIWEKTTATGFHDSFSPEKTLEEIDSMEPLQFENWVGSIFKRAGFHVSTTPRSGDGGADVIVKNVGSEHDCIIIQCKHRQTQACDDQAVKDLLRAQKNYPEGERALLMAITNAPSYTRKAKEKAQRNNIILVGREDLLCRNFGLELTQFQ